MRRGRCLFLTLRLYEGLSKPQCAILIQMRTMRIGLRHFLFEIKAADSDQCSCGAGSQTPKHVLMQCAHYVEFRKQLWGQLDEIKGLETDYDKIVSYLHATRYVANFMHRTGLLSLSQYEGIEDDDDASRSRGHGPRCGRRWVLANDGK